MKKKTYIFIIIIMLMIIIMLAIYAFIFKLNPSEEIPVEIEEQPEIVIEKYGENIKNWTLYTDTVRGKEYVGTILARYGISMSQVDNISRQSTDSLRTTLIREGHPYTIFSDTIIDSIPIAKLLIYENSRTTFTKYDFRRKDTVLIERFRKDIDTVQKEVSGVIHSSLWNTLVNNGYSWELAVELSHVFGWTVDFYSIQAGNWFKALYDEYLSEGESVGIGEIKGGVFYQGGKELWAIPFTQNKERGFYDTLGNSMKKSFLPAPLKYTRISSRYTTSRLHPVHKRNVPHLAVDFAAPTGTPVYASSDGVIVTRQYGNGAGNYVVIKHNKVYSTAYMHFSKFGSYKVGDRVSQGDVIGYVGSTGWATGPHLHYEIRENGKKINPLSFSPPPAEPIDSINMPRFNQEKRKWIDQINKIELDEKHLNTSLQ